MNLKYDQNKKIPVRLENNMPKTILVADDVEDVKETIKTLLEHEKFNVVTCGSNDCLLELIKKKEYSLAIVDSHMPGIKIQDFLNELVKFKTDIPIVVMSGTHPQNMREICQKSDYKHIKAFIEKPFNNTEFVKIIKEVLKTE